MKAATLFSGIGAPEQAMPGWQWLWGAEVDPFASAVLATHHPSSVTLGDVTAPDFVERASNVGRPDVLVFGSPCQSFSIAGKRLGMDDPRGDLALVALGVVRDLRPEWFVLENVPGLLSHDGGRSFGAILGIMGQLGYGFAYRVLDAQFFGVPQRRERVFVIGHLGDWRRAAAILFEPESLCGHPAPSREAGESVARPLAAGAPGSSGYRNDGDTAENLIAHALNAKGGIGRIDAESETFVTHSLRGEGFDPSEDGTGRGTPLVAFTCKDYGADASAASPTLRAMGHDKTWANGGGQVAVAFNWQSGGDCRGLEPRAITMALSREQTPAMMQGSAVRRLMPSECELLQGFPRDYTAIEFRGKPAADGPRYRVLGNSMAVPVMRWILGRLELMATAKRRSAAA